MFGVFCLGFRVEDFGVSGGSVGGGGLCGWYECLAGGTGVCTSLCIRALPRYLKALQGPTELRGPCDRAV